MILTIFKAVYFLLSNETFYGDFPWILLVVGVRTAEITSQFYSFIFSKGRRDAEFEPSSKEANMYWEEMGFFEPIEKSR